jgi:tetratricopeptide (TPR) repeat protein
MRFLVNDYASAGRTDEAIALYKRIINAETEKLGADHKITLVSMSGLARLYADNGLIDDAIVLYERILAVRLQTRVADDRETNSMVESLAAAYERTGRTKESIQLWLRYGYYYGAVVAARRADHDLMSMIINEAISEDPNQIKYPIDRLVIGELRLLAGHYPSAEAAIRSSLQNSSEGRSTMYKSLGVVLFAEQKFDEASAAFREALAKFRQPDGRIELKGADHIDMTSAYFLDLVSQNEYVEFTKGNKALACFPWFYVGQRKEFEGDRQGAIDAYKRSVELGDDETAEKTRALSKWRLAELTKPSAELP